MKPYVKVELGPDSEPTIINPFHKGAAIDYKATTFNLAEQLLSAQTDLALARHNEYTSNRSSAQWIGRNSEIRASLQTVANHWSFFLLPQWLRDEIRVWLTPET